MSMTFVEATLRMSAGVIIWSLHFLAVYGVTGLACARGRPDVVAPGVAIATALACAALVPLIVAGYRRRTVFEHWLSATVGAFALVAIVYEGIPVLLVRSCG
jgi:hypothetical protein